ncbi:NB-ARC domain-containing protein [Oscillatoria sp. FACHB-1406]|uniref:NB-ARC domain-containing protein n=1 Tax=Oscillatoria sp. FACHB-1406 TaxID=2692846 RepID=UPI001685D0FC|nr:NB-ARC domain-containing protein [Oscillatoria sp. FACHB-1406]MBD2579788.1 hypothetical protein [Oscillatoria sp. FACHB-1406]
MTVDEALILIKKAGGDRYFNTVREIVFRQSWQGESYGKIARDYDYNEGYVKDTGYRLWSFLSEIFGEKVTKNNLHLVLKRYQQQQQNLARLAATTALPHGRENAIAPIAHNLPVRHCTAFQERNSELSQLSEWLGDYCTYPWMGIEGVAGAGKTTLALELAYRCLGAAVPPVEAIAFVSAQSHYRTPHGAIARLKPDRTLADILRALAQTLNLTQLSAADFETLYDGVKTHLRQHRTLLILDRWESFTEPEQILAFLYDLPLTVKAIVTSRQPLLSVKLSLSLLPYTQILPLVV